MGEGAKRFAEVLIAESRAETDSSALPRNELNPAPVARVGTAGQAPIGAGRGLESLTAQVAIPHQTTVREASAHRREQVADLTPDRVIRGCVTWPTERHQVVDVVGGLVVIEEAEWADVVDGESRRDSATPARVTVTLQCEAPLPFPVRPAVSSVSASPCGIVGALHARHKESIAGMDEWM